MRYGYFSSFVKISFKNFGLSATLSITICFNSSFSFIIKKSSIVFTLFVDNGKIFLLTNGKYFGYCFNPVSFYYCFNNLNKLIAIVSHITNTPWNEKYAYVHDCKSSKGGTKEFNFDKCFHVSPFMPMNIKYNWKYTEPKDFLFVSMNSFEKENFNFNATLRLTKKAWTPWALNKIILMFPPSTFRTIIVIYWNALLLKLKRVPSYPHP